MKIARFLVFLGLFSLVGAASLCAQAISVNALNSGAPPPTNYFPPPNALVGAITVPQPPPDGSTVEYVILSGGPSLIQWEKYKASPHDQFWGGFVRAARTRIQLLQGQLRNNPNALITWLVYLEGYRARAKQDQQDLLANIYSVRDKYKINFVPIENGKDVIAYLNNGQPRDRVKIIDFEYFGHSNRACFMFDYSNNIDSASKAWLHEDELTNLRRNLFTRNAFVKSWGCHTGESMSKKFYAATGTRMIGAIGRTDYSFRDEVLNGVFPVLSSVDGKWVQ
jgi:hypothetical protein